MGIVYKALDPTIGRTVAIKAIRLSDFQDPAERRRVHDRLLREAQSAGLLSHPNIITIYDVLEEEDSAYIVMEYVGGASLERMLRSNTLPDREPLLHYLRQVADALDYAHRNDIVHRDVKPANIIITGSGDETGKLAKVADFGVAKFISHDATYSGSMIGTPNYMSPEQIQGLPLDGRSDQFSLAVVVYEVLTGTKPFAADSLPALLYQICRTEPRWAQELNGTLNENVGNAVARGMAKEPDARFGTCSEFVETLSPALAENPHWTLPTGESRNPAAVLAAAASTGSVAVPVQIPQPTPPEPALQELPSLTRRKAEPEETGKVPPERSSLRKKLLLLVLMGFAVGAVITLIVRWNSSSPVPVQRVEPKLAPHTPPPYLPNLPSTDETGSARKKLPDIERTPKPRGSVEPAPASTPATATSTVEFLTEPPGARVTVDNRADVACQSPCTLPLPSGRHTLGAEMNGFNPAKHIFTVPNETSVFITLSKSMGVLIVTSTPGGSPVVVDGKDYGLTPITLRLTTGPHQLLLTNGRQRHEETIVIGNDTFETRSVLWQ